MNQSRDNENFFIFFKELLKTAGNIGLNKYVLTA